jgi:hypothetical protein
MFFWSSADIQAIKQAIYVCKTLLYEKENISRRKHFFALKLWRYSKDHETYIWKEFHIETLSFRMEHCCWIFGFSGFFLDSNPKKSIFSALISNRCLTSIDKSNETRIRYTSLIQDLNNDFMLLGNYWISLFFSDNRISMTKWSHLQTIVNVNWINFVNNEEILNDN